MRQQELTRSATDNGLQPSGLTLETAHEMLTAASAFDFMATDTDATNPLLAGVCANMSLALRSKTAQAVKDAVPAEHCLSKPNGTTLTLQALGAAAANHPEKQTRGDAASMLELYELAILELQFAGPSAPPETL